METGRIMTHKIGATQFAGDMRHIGEWRNWRTWTRMQGSVMIFAG